MAWPVCISSTCAVERPGRGPLADELLLRAAGDQDRDHDREGHGQERDDRQQGADQDHHDEHADHRQQGGDQLGQALLERLPDVVDVVRDPAQDVAPGVPVEVLERQPAELLVDVPAQPVDRPLGDPGHDVGLHPAEGRAEQVDAGQEQQDPAQGAEVDPLAGGQGQAGEHVGQLSLAGGAQPGHCLGLGHADGQLLADRALEDDVGGVAQDLGPDDREGHADDREDEDEDDQGRLGPQPGQQPAKGDLEVLGLLGGHPAHHSARTAHPPAHRRAAARTETATGRRAARSRGAAARSAAHATASASDSCE